MESVEDVKDLHRDLVISEIIYIEEEISKFRNPTSNFSNYIPLLRPLNTVAGWLGLQKGSHMADVGKRRYAYHHVLQEKLKKDIADGVDRPCIQGNVLKDPESKGLTEGELLSIGLSMLAGADTTKRSLMWAILLLAHRPDIQERAYKEITETDVYLLESPHVAHSRVEYVEAFTKEIGRYFVVQRLALPKATYSHVQWKGAVIPPNTLLFLNSWACTRGEELIPIDHMRYQLTTYAPRSVRILGSRCICTRALDGRRSDSESTPVCFWHRRPNVYRKPCCY